ISGLVSSFVCFAILCHSIPFLSPYTTLFRSSFTRQTPVDNVFQEVTETTFFDVIGIPVDGAVVANQVVTQSGHFDEPCASCVVRSEEHTSELQSRFELICRLLLEKKKMEYRK